MTRAELTAKVKSLHSVGGLYEIVALVVEADNAPHVVDLDPYDDFCPTCDAQEPNHTATCAVVADGLES